MYAGPDVLSVEVEIFGNTIRINRRLFLEVNIICNLDISYMP
jgi:hypothetical protein